MANQDTFSAATTAHLESNSYDFKSWLDAKLPSELVQIQNVHEDDIVDTMADMLNESYKKTKYLPKLQDITDCPQIYLVKLGQLMGIENFDLLKAKIAATSGASEENYGEDEINTFRRYIKESVFRYKKKGTLEAITKIFYYLNYLIDAEELWTDDWLEHFPEDEILSKLSSDLSLSELFNVSSYQTSGMITSGGDLDSISVTTSGGQVVRMVQSAAGYKFIIVDGGTETNTIFYDEGNGYIDSGISNVSDMWTFLHRDSFDPLNEDLQYGLLSYIQSGQLYIVAESDLTTVLSTYTDATVLKYINVDDESDNKYMYFETANKVIRVDGNFFSMWDYIDKTQRGTIPTVTIDSIVPIDTGSRLYFFKNEYHSDNDYSILARGWNQEIPDAVETTSTPFSAATTSGDTTTGFTSGSTTIYDYLSFGKYTSGGTDYNRDTYQDPTSAVVFGTATSGWNPLKATYYVDEADIEEGDSAHLYIENDISFTSAYYFNSTLTIGTSAVPYNLPDFRIRHARYNYDVIYDRTNEVLEVTYQKGTSLYRDSYHNIKSTIDPNKKNTKIILTGVLKYLDSEQTKDYMIRSYIDTTGVGKIMIEAKTSSQVISSQTFSIEET